MRSFSYVVLSIGALCACRSSNSTKPNIDGDTTGPSVTIQQVHDDSMVPPGSAVSLTGVIVTAVDNYGGRTGDIWVEEPGGGPFSGVHVYKGDPTVVSTLTPGDIVSISNAQKSDFTYQTDMTGRYDVELEPPTSNDMVHVTKTGTGTVPAPSPVDALMIGKLTDANNNGDRSAQWNMWDGVLVSLSNVTVTSSPKEVPSSKSPDPTDNEFNITGVAVVESEIAAFPTTGLVFDACLSNVTGVVSYFFDYEILPTATTDIAVASGTSACPAPENSAALCADSIDNDGNGYSDCMDDNCIILATSSTCRAATTINAVDTASDANPTMPTLPAGAPVGTEIGNGGSSDPYVIAISMDNKNIWVADAKAAAADHGLDIYNSSGVLPSGLAVGNRVDVIGKLEAYNNDSQGNALTQMDALQITISSTTTGTPTATTQTVATLTGATSGLPYIGSLVTIDNIKLATAPDPNNHNIGSLMSGTTAVEVESDIYTLTSAAGTCYASITGIWSYDVYTNAYALEPIAEGSTTGGVCL